MEGLQLKYGETRAACGICVKAHPPSPQNTKFLFFLLVSVHTNKLTIKHVYARGPRAFLMIGVILVIIMKPCLGEDRAVL